MRASPGTLASFRQTNCRRRRTDWPRGYRLPLREYAFDGDARISSNFPAVRGGDAGPLLRGVLGRGSASGRCSFRADDHHALRPPRNRGVDGGCGFDDCVRQQPSTCIVRKHLPGAESEHLRGFQQCREFAREAVLGNGAAAGVPSISAVTVTADECAFAVELFGEDKGLPCSAGLGDDGISGSTPATS